MSNIVNSISSGVSDIISHPLDVGRSISDFGNAEGQMYTLSNWTNPGNAGAPGAPTGGGPGGLLLPTTQQMVDQTYNNVNGGLAQQQQFLQALQAQNGIKNQNAAFQNAQNLANGVGPNPAQAQLAQATASNTANQAALMAGQRGSAANPALIARQAAMQGANNQQQSAGQAATLAAQQQLAGQQQMAALANQQVANQGAAQQQYNQNALSGQQNIMGGIANQNQVIGGMTNAGTAADATRYAADKKQNGDMFGGLMNGLGGQAGMMSVLAAAEGGQVPQYADGGRAEPSAWDNIKSAFDEPVKSAQPKQAVSSEDAKSMQKVFGDTTSEANGGMIRHYDMGGPISPMQQPMGPQSELGKAMSGMQGRPMMMAKGGQVPALVSPGEQYLPPSAVQKVKQGANPLKEGERIPGKPKYPGNDYRNDIVPKTLETGGVVIPNHIMQSKDREKKAAAFVAAVAKKHALGKGK